MNWIRRIERPVRKTQPSTSAGLLLTRKPVEVENTILAIIINIMILSRRIRRREKLASAHKWREVRNLMHMSMKVPYPFSARSGFSLLLILLDHCNYHLARLWRTLRASNEAILSGGLEEGE